MRVGDCFVGAADGRAYQITGWLKDRSGDCPKVVDLVSGETDIFAGCATPHGPFTADQAREFATEVQS